MPQNRACVGLAFVVFFLSGGVGGGGNLVPVILVDIWVSQCPKLVIGVPIYREQQTCQMLNSCIAAELISELRKCGNGTGYPSDGGGKP